jgi:hypothetical protein
MIVITVALVILISYLLMLLIVYRFKYTSKETQTPIPIRKIIKLFDVNNFNKWFNDPNNNSTYSHSGIFLRLDKLSQSMIEEYINSHENDTDRHFDETLLITFMDDIRKDWLKKINK